MIAIVDYGLGNLKAFVNLYERLNVKTVVARDSQTLIDCSKIILPGVGAFDQAMKLINDSGMRKTLDNLVLVEKMPILGVCIGMQILAKSSEEGLSSGLGYIDGKVKKLDVKNIKGNTQLPHMGWNTILPIRDSKLLAGINAGSRFYFLHSFYVHCNNNNDVISTTEYGSKFCSAIEHNNIFGVQYHPEKSHSNGIKMLQNFAEM